MSDEQQSQGEATNPVSSEAAVTPPVADPPVADPPVADPPKVEAASPVADPPKVEEESVEPEAPEHPLGSIKLAKANGLPEIHAAAYAAHFRKLRQEGSSEMSAHVAAAEKTDEPTLSFKAKSVLRNEEVIIQPGEPVTHLSGDELLDLLSRDAVELV